MKSEASRHSSRIVAKYKSEAAALKGRLLEEEALSSNAGLPPPGMLRVAASHNPSFRREIDRPVSVPTVSIQQQMSNWQYTLAKPVTAQQPRTNQSWRSSLDIRNSNKGSAQGDPGSLRSSSAIMQDSPQSRSGYWKGQKLTGGSKNSRGSTRQLQSQQMSPMADVMAHMGHDWNIPDTADAGKQHSTLYAHVESRLLAGGFIPRARGSVMAVNLDHPFMDMEDAQGEAMQILRDTMHPVHDGKVNTATVEEALANKLSALHKLSQHSDELERQMEEYQGAPGKMQQWLSDANRRRHMEDSGISNDQGHKARKAQPQYPFGPSHGRRMSPQKNRDVTTLQEPVEPVDPRRLGNRAMDDFFGGLQTLDSQRAASSAPRLDLEGAQQSPAPRQRGSMDLDAGVVNKQELHGRLVEYFHGNAALADDCLKAVWDLARPPVSNQAAGFMFGGDWQEVIPEDENPFPSPQGNMQERNARGFTPSIGKPDSRSITSAPQPSNHGNFKRQSSAALRPTSKSSLMGSSIVPVTPGTALGHHHPAARIEALGKKHWHSVLFPSSQPATNRSLDMLEQWVVAMAEHLGIDMGDVLFAEQERVNKSPPATQQGESRGEPPGTRTHAAGAVVPELEEPSGFFEKAFLLYSVAYLELVRQVTIQSAQRGELLLRLWHSICRLLSSLLKSMDKQLNQDKEKFDESYQKGFVDGKLEGDGNVAHWKAKVNSTSNFLEQQRAKWREEKAALHQEMSNKDQSIKQFQAELDSSREKLAKLLEASGK